MGIIINFVWIECLACILQWLGIKSISLTSREKKRKTGERCGGGKDREKNG